MRYKHYEYIIMSFELKNVFTIFQQLINNTIKKYLDNFVITYLNDILIYLKDLKMYYRHVHKILKKWKKKTLYVKQSKSRFKIQKIRFLDYVIQSECIEKDSEKTAAIRNWSMLMRLRKVQIFLVLANYYWKFVLNYSQIVKSFTRLMWKTKR